MVYKVIDDDTIKVPRFNKESGFYSTEKSSITMRRIKSKNTKVEILFRKTLWKQGFRYTINNKSIPGKPDIVFHKQRIAIFIDGDFWHGYDWENKKRKLKANKDYWIAKIERNIQRDEEITEKLINEKWKVFRFWEHDVFNNMGTCIEIIIKAASKSEAAIVKRF